MYLKFECFRNSKERKGTTLLQGSGIYWEDMRKGWVSREGQKSAFGWLRGKDLNLRPLGYEFDLCFVWFHVVPSISMT